MARILKIIICVVLVGLAALAAFAAVTPPHYQISRSIRIHAGAEQLFPFINNSKKSNEWMPWAESDPSVKMTFSGPDEGVGSVSSWNSTGHMGDGRAEVIESVPNQKVVTKLTYTKPMAMQQVAEIALQPSEGETVVTWSVSGESPLLARMICIVLNMDKMVGSEFEKGLSKLKRIVEAAPN